jgi:hypothetical protein
VVDDAPDPAASQTPRWTDYVRLDQVEIAQLNPKLHDEGGIAAAIAHHGFGELPLRDERTGRLVAGHGRYDQLVAMHAEGKTAPDGIIVDPDGMWRMPVTAGWASRSDEDALAYLIGSNRLTEKGGNDDVVMTEALLQLDAVNLLDLTGYDRGDLDAMEALYRSSTGGEFGEDDLDDLADQLGKGSKGELWPMLSLRVPPILHESWKAHLDTHSGDEAQAFAALLEVDPAELP